MLDASQLSALQILCRSHGGVVWHKVGEGKTRIGLAWFANFAKDVTRGCNLFVVVCRRKSFSSWIRESKMITPEFRICSIEDWAGICTSKPTILLVSHGMLVRFEDVIVDGRTYAVIYDEGYKFKNARTSLCKVANRISKVVRNCTIMGGSVMTARNIEDVWGQLFAINRHTRLCSGLTKFRSRYLRRIPIGSMMKFVPRPDSFTRISQAIASFTSIHFPSDRIKTRDREFEVAPTEQQKELLEQAKDFLFDVGGEITELKNAVSMIAKVCQISDGVFKTATGQIVQVDSSKIRVMRRLVARLVSEGGVVIWAGFRATVKRILQDLQSEYKCYTMMGGSRFDEEGWHRDGQVAIATVGSGDSVNFFKNCRNVIYYSRDCKLLSEVQSRGRSMRKDSEHSKCNFYHLFTEGTMDRRIKALVNQSRITEQDLKKELTLWAKDI